MEIVLRTRLKSAALLTLFVWFIPAAVADSIRQTVHTLVAPGPAGTRTKDRQICVFCHTPEVTPGQVAANPPQWQPNLAKEHTFTIYDDIGRLGVDRAVIGSQSVACLSCHDANQAFAAMNNNANLDHPYGIPYRGVTKDRNTGTADLLPDPDQPALPRVRAKKMVAEDEFRDASQGVIENRPVWWVSRTGATARRGRDDLPLYGRKDHKTNEITPYVECTSCHDPHTPNQLFLRLNNDISTLCQTCHSK
jgi:predicted CXXCH cytochrome family protein